MTRVGWVGLGKLGLPCALALEVYGQHEVTGYDVNPEIAGYLDRREVPYREEGMAELLGLTSLKLADTIGDVVAASDVVFLAVQTPHAPAYEGATPVPETRRDFEYAYLVQAVREVCRAADAQAHDITLVIVSTVLPGTMSRLVRPLVNAGRRVRLVYNPFFIAMGTTVADFVRPEFVLLGADNDDDTAPVEAVYASLHDRPRVRMSVESAELTKVAYNTFIGLKIVFANTLMELCHATGADVDEVTGALGKATDRLISPRYMTAGMGDGGGCHPRDNIAMSWLAERAGLSVDLFGTVAYARDEQTRWLARLTADYAYGAGLPVVILGKAYKPESNLTAGSPALLLDHLLDEQAPGLHVAQWDPHVDGERPFWLDDYRAVYVVATRHQEFLSYAYPPGSVVLDPWGAVGDQDGVTVVRIGRKQ